MSSPQEINGRTTVTTAAGTTRELVEGLSGSGHRIWAVQSVTVAGRVYQENFDSKAEALCWMEWA